MRENKKAVSPVIATVLLVLIVVIIAIIILVWFLGFVNEAISKNIAGVEKPVEKYCSEIKFRAIVNADDSFGFENIGSVPIYAFDLKLVEKDSGDSEIISVLNTGGGSANPGDVLILGDLVSVNGYEYYDKIEIIPILFGKTDSGTTSEFMCSNSDRLVIK